MNLLLWASLLIRQRKLSSQANQQLLMTWSTSFSKILPVNLLLHKNSLNKSKIKRKHIYPTHARFAPSLMKLIQVLLVKFVVVQHQLLLKNKKSNRLLPRLCLLFQKLSPQQRLKTKKKNKKRNYRKKLMKKLLLRLLQLRKRSFVRSLTELKKLLSSTILKLIF